MKMWCQCGTTINRIVESQIIDFIGEYFYNTGEIKGFPLKGRLGIWEVEIKSPTWMEVSGSIHKYWNSLDGIIGNGNDFDYKNLIEAIIHFSNTITINPLLLSIHNLEFGINLSPDINATDFLRNLICFRNKPPIRPLSKKEGYYLKFKSDDFFLKFYDKGKQAINDWNVDIGNVMRGEIKARKQRYVADANISTLADLLVHENLNLLGVKIAKVFDDAVFNDHTITHQAMTVADRENYLQMSNPKEWENTTSAARARKKRFKEIVEKYGALKLNSTLSQLAYSGWNKLSEPTPTDIQLAANYIQHCNKSFCRNSHLIYSRNIDITKEEKKCITCGKDISHQRKQSKFCSAKYVGEKQAQRCRNGVTAIVFPQPVYGKQINLSLVNAQKENVVMTSAPP